MISVEFIGMHESTSSLYQEVVTYVERFMVELAGTRT